MIIVFINLTKPVSREELRKYDVNPYNPHEVAAFKAPGHCCPLGLWFIVAVPLSICAIATWGKG